MNKDEKEKQNIGSQWRKWDLHVHSPASDGFSGTFEQFETQLKNADCDVIGINDYFSVAGYKQIKEKIDEGNLDIGGKKILPVVEFRMTESVQNRNTTTNGVTHFNFHIIFDDQIKITDIENLIKGLKSNGTKISSDYDDKAKLKNKKISLDSLLTELSQDEKFKDKFLLWLPYDEYGGIDEIDPESDKWIKENYIKKADILGSSRQKQIDFFLWKPDLKADGTVKFTQDQFRDWFLRKKACIKGSDSHTHDYPIGKLKDKDSKPIEKYCWIKAESTFEGLKQIVYEPETRISIGGEKPKKPINTIDTITLKIPSDAKVGEDKFCFAGNNCSYNLSPYFNCFIGGRGSGKSTILNFLGLHSNSPESPKKFWDNLSPSFDPNDNNIFSFGGTEIFEFLAQSEIETFARDKSKFTQAIYDRANSHAGNILEEYEEEIESLKGKLGQIIQAVSDLKTLEDQKVAKEKEKRTLESSVKVLSSNEYNQIITGITDKSKELQKLENWKENISDLKNSLSDLIPEFEFEESREEIEKTEYEKAYNLAIAKIAEAVELLKEEKFVDEAKKESEIKNVLTELESKAKTLIEKAGYTIQTTQSNIASLTAGNNSIDYIYTANSNNNNGGGSSNTANLTTPTSPLFTFSLKPVSLTTPTGTTINSSSTVPESSLTAQDNNNQYPLGLINFSFTTNQSSNQVVLNFETDLKPNQVVAKKYNSNTNTYTNLPTNANVSITETTINNKHHLTLTYTIIDNGELDLDPTTGIIKDPVGLAVSNSTYDQLANTGSNNTLPIVIATSLITLASSLWLLSRRRNDQY